MRRIYASKGVTGPGHALIRPRAQSRVHRGSVDLRLVGVDTAKEALYANLREESGAGYCAFPSGYRDEKGVLVPLPTYDREYFEQLTAEQLETSMDGMTPVRRWVKQRERNEALDCRVYAMAALEDLNVKWKTLAKNVGSQKPRVIEAEEPTKQAEQTPLIQLKSGKKRRKVVRIPGHAWING